MLFDPHHRRITAILDFDWARISFVADECLQSFHKRYARLPGPKETDVDRIHLRAALLQPHGFPFPLPSNSKIVEWDLARIWDEQLTQHKVSRPRTINGIKTLSWLYALGDALCPSTLLEDVIVRQRTKDSLGREKIDTAKMLSQYLEESSN